MNRPIGVALTGVVLGLVSAGTLLMLASLVWAAGNAPQPDLETKRVAGLLGVAFMALVLTAAAAWTGFTAVGVVRLRSWARYSLLTFAGLLLVSGSMGAFGAAIGIGAMRSNLAAQGQALDPAALRTVAVALASTFVGVIALGVFWLVYFNLRSVRAAFVPLRHTAPPGSHLQQLRTFGPAGSPGWDKSALLPRPDAVGPVAGHAPAFAPPAPARRFVYHVVDPDKPRLPSSVAILAAALGLLGVSGLLCAALPIPAFLGGFIIPGVAGRLVFLLSGAVMAFVSWGLFRLDNRARLAMFGLIALGSINLAASLSPWYSQQLIRYMIGIYQSVGVPEHFLNQLNRPYPLSLTITSFCWGLAVYGAIVWALQRHHTLFRTSPRSSGRQLPTSPRR